MNVDPKLLATARREQMAARFKRGGDKYESIKTDEQINRRMLVDARKRPNRETADEYAGDADPSYEFE